MRKTERQFVEIDVASIVGATENLRDTAPRLSQQGYGLFKGTDEQPESLHALALSDDGQKQGQFVALIDKHEPAIKELADNMATTGQLEPIRVRPAENKGKYDLVFGARRTMARLYIHARSGGKIPARVTAEIADQSDQDALYASISENIRAEPSPMDEARSYARLKKNLGMSAREIGTAMGRSEKVVQTRLRLLRLPKDLQEKVHLGKVGVERALMHLDGEQKGRKEEPTRKAPSLRDIKALYSAPVDELPDDMRPLITEDVRRLFAFWLGVKYQPRTLAQVV